VSRLSARIDAQATDSYVKRISGSTKTVVPVAGHRDWLPTQCPGNLFALELDSVRADVARLLATMPVGGALLS
jgi:hypothetical protein